MSRNRDSASAVLSAVSDSGAGKSSLLFRFSHDTFTPRYTSTIGVDFKRKGIELGIELGNGEKIHLQVWDCAGQKRFRTITSNFYRSVHGIILVYDTTKESFQNVMTWLAETERNGCGNVKKLLVGNKCDLNSQKIVSLDSGRRLAQELRIPLLETSAKDSTNVDEISLRIAGDIQGGLRRSEGGSVSYCARNMSVQLGEVKANNYYYTHSGCC